MHACMHACMLLLLLLLAAACRCCSKEARYAMERASGAAIDWGDENERNLLMFESAVPLARLYNIAFVVDDTFVLQVRDAPFFSEFSLLNHDDSIYPDSIGTNTRETQKGNSKKKGPRFKQEFFVPKAGFRECKETRLFAPFCSKNHHFTKTGSGQT